MLISSIIKIRKKKPYSIRPIIPYACSHRPYTFHYRAMHGHGLKAVFNRDMIMDTDTYFSTFLSYLYLNTTYTGSYINTTLSGLVVLRTPGPINKHLPLKSAGLEFRNRSTF